MELQKSRIAMISPSINVYSETFIQEQKNGLKGRVFYYFGGEIPQYLEGFGKLGTRYTAWSIKLKRKLGLKTFSFAETALIHSLKKNKIEVVLAQYGTTAHRIVKICKHIDIPLITHFHGYDASVKSVIADCNQYKEVFNYSSYIIVVSKKMEMHLQNLGCSSEKLIYNTYGPSTLFLEQIPQFSNQIFLGIGRFVNKKAPYYTILAFKKVHDQFPDSKLIIAGTGELYEPCVNLIRYLKLEDSVSLPGIIDRNQFLNYLQKALAFVQHSITAINGDQEGTPVAILEASAAGLPVISTMHAGIPDVIIDNHTGFLIEEHDVDAMAEKMKILLENKDLAEQFGNNGKEHIKNNFTLKKHLDVIDDLIKKAINNTHG
ncbi:glycosyltransferase involved in cell wall biosynthesis [Flavobacterium sp. 270]|uniref:glycosyltransferase n=1 Tax=Flavobacterium sp. 270 TaxID=2512114 RepID=UPI0010650E68|nr:glycosyltransferase [Flavobacterium sp. 270]TDW47145.1 glycosyltransferase involved in cell wall biosynthesis [Flavobacterium sp. 270]